MTSKLREQLIDWAETYNDPVYFAEDPIAFPRKFFDAGASLQDIEIAAVFAAHLAWGRRAMIVRDCTRLFDEMEWRPLDYILAHDYRNDPTSLHRTVKWSEIAAICERLYRFYLSDDRPVPPETVSLSLDPTASAVPPLMVPRVAQVPGAQGCSSVRSIEELRVGQIRTLIFGQKEDPKAANKKINMMRRWMVRDDGKVDLGLWKDTDPSTLLIPLDVHVHEVALQLGLTSRKSKDIMTVKDITESFSEIFPSDPCKGDFALFGYGVTHPGEKQH